MKYKSVTLKCCPVEFAFKLEMVGMVDEYPFVAVSWVVICLSVIFMELY